MVELYFQKSYLMTIYGINMSETVFSCSFFKFIPKGKHMIVSCIFEHFYHLQLAIKFILNLYGNKHLHCTKECVCVYGVYVYVTVDINSKSIKDINVE